MIITSLCKQHKSYSKMFDDYLKLPTQLFLGAVIIFMLFMSVLLAFSSGHTLINKIMITSMFFFYGTLILSAPIIIFASVIQVSSEWPEGSKNRKT